MASVVMVASTVAANVMAMVLAADAGAVAQLEPVQTGFERPVYLTHAGAAVFVVEQRGVIRRLGERGAASVFLDIRDRVTSRGNEQGLLSAAFHPRYASNGAVFVNYTGDAGASIVSRFLKRSGGQADPESEQILLRVEQPYGNHNGGQLQFGPDGYLYIGMGDGGAGGDPLDAGQDNRSLLGALLRIDVDRGRPYAIPPDNPFAARPGAGRAEIWAYGLRNPWRFSFDALTGDLFIADVGQNRREEINWQPAGVEGGQNYGWRWYEGSRCFERSACRRPADRPTNLTRPIAEYAHTEGCSVTGGYMYRGQQYPSLAGRYFFGDYCSGTIWSLQRRGDEWLHRVELHSALSISSFGEDAKGNVYVLDLAGTVYRLVASKTH
ncbi:MAG: glucose dehydrogenase [Gammaproteobacteria bacterium]|nr:glucose dehydrogenase [Gammaproteobacteria bacterium]